MMGKNSFSLLPQLNLLVVAPVNVIKYQSTPIEGASIIPEQVVRTLFFSFSKFTDTFTTESNSVLQS